MFLILSANDTTGYLSQNENFLSSVITTENILIVIYLTIEDKFKKLQCRWWIYCCIHLYGKFVSNIARLQKKLEICIEKIKIICHIYTRYGTGFIKGQFKGCALAVANILFLKSSWWLGGIRSSGEIIPLYSARRTMGIA